MESKLKIIKNNYIIGYSLLLITVVVGVILFSNYYSLKRFEDSTDKLLQSKAVLAEDIFSVLVSDEDGFGDGDFLQSKIDKIMGTDSEVKKIEVAIPQSGSEEYKIVASSNKSNVGQELGGNFVRIAFSNDSGLAFLNRDENGRYWEVVKVIKNADDKRIGVVSFQMSLAEHDNFIRNSVRKIYLVLLLSMLLVLLVIANHVRFFKYALKASKLEEVDRMKDDFISMASHELKSPLTTIKGYVEILREAMLSKGLTVKKEDEKILKNIEISVDRLNELVVDLLDVSRIQQNRMPIDLEKVDIGEIVEQTVAEFKLEADKKGLKLSYDNFGQLYGLADKKRLKQILVNLVSNAIKYTPKGSVEIKVKEDNKNIFITVADTGLGISAGDLKNLFAKFYRVKTDKTAKIHGTGLGLWISREIARKMKGDLIAESIEGVGSHFTLKLRKYRK